MLTPTYLMNVADPLVELFAEAEQRITNELEKDIAQIGSIKDISLWPSAKRRMAGTLSVKVDAILRETEQKGQTIIDRIMAQATESAMVTDNAIYAAAGITAPSVEASPVLSAIIMQGTETTAALLHNFTHTTAIAASNAFYNAVDSAYLQVITGQSDLVSAIRRTVNTLASQGVTKLAYPSGGHISIEAGIRRAMVTGLNQSVAKLQLARADELGCELVEVSSHAGARPSHAEWQGEVYCIKGHHPRYGDFYRETGYGTGEGLCGWNCYHSFYPFFEGLSTHSFSHDPSADAGRDNDEDYWLSQKQREYERAIREAKKRCQAIDTARGNTNNPVLHNQLDRDFDNAATLLKQREARLRTFLSEHGRTRNPEREHVGLWNRSISGKAVWANRKSSGR